MQSKHTICRDIQGKKYKVLTENLNYRPSVYGIIIKDNKILLSKQNDGYDFPGGGIEKGESIENALKREVWEETGIKIKPGKLIKATEDFFIGIETKKSYHSTLLYYLCTNATGKISTKNFHGYETTYLSAAEWVNLANVKKLKFYNAVNSPKLIQEALKVLLTIK